jgi:hypothetical protein
VSPSTQHHHDVIIRKRFTLFVLTSQICTLPWRCPNSHHGPLGEGGDYSVPVVVALDEIFARTEGFVYRREIEGGDLECLIVVRARGRCDSV